MFVSPGPEITISTPTRPKIRVSSRAISISRGVRAAKSACPPSDGAGTKRPSTLCSSATPRPVPAAITAAFPPGSARPCCSVSISSPSSTGTPYASASRSFSTRTWRNPRFSATNAPSTTHGTLVRRATCAVTAPATPNTVASTARTSTLRARRNSRTIGSSDSYSSVTNSPTSIGVGRQIIQHADVAQPQVLGHECAVDHPRHVGKAGDLRRDRSGHAEHRGVHRADVDAARAQELAHHRLERFVLERDELADLDWCRSIGSRVEKSEQRLGSPDITGQQHG